VIGVSGLATQTIERVRRAWADLAGIGTLERGAKAVLVQADSALCPSGWVGILYLDGSLVVVVPAVEFKALATAALAGLPIERVPDFSLVASDFGPVEATLGPAVLMYADHRSLRPSTRTDVDQVPKGDQRVAELVESVSIEDRNEADVLDVTSPMFVAMLGGEIVSVCGYRVWAGVLAHLSVVTHPDVRNRGLAKSVGGAAAAHALANGLVPQWRARPKASQAVGRSLGFRALGAQLSVRIASASSS
jgi:hypothetical protein